MPSEPALLLRHHRPFIAFWLARIFTASGFQMLTVAIGWNLYQLTGNVLDLGLVGLVEFVPRVLFMLHTGHVADRYERRKVAAICQTLQALIALSLAIGGLTGNVTREMIFILAFLLGAARSFEMPTTQALLPSIVPSALFPRAVASSQSAQQLATIVAPALGGLLYAFGSVWVYGPTVALYLIACVLTLNLPARQTPLNKGKATLDSLLAGIRFIRSRPDILGAISLDLFAVLLGGATALLPVFAKDILLTGRLGPGPAAFGTGGGGVVDVVVVGAVLGGSPGRPRDVYRRRRIWRGNHRLRSVDLVLVLPGSVGGTRRGGHDQHGDPRVVRAAGNAG
ncbi:MFS family permease [Pseudomonas synxantha]|nr:MFS family permease [Pseudomonas synxantha]